MLRSKLTNYVDKWGKVEQGAAPFALHMIGPPGIGKTSVFSVLEQMGVRVVRIEAQSYVGENAAKLTDLWSKIAEAEKASKTQPTILAFDDIDKIREIVSTGGRLEERPNSFIGAVLNPLLNEGRVVGNRSETATPTMMGMAGGGGDYKLSNVMVLTTMNFDPTDVTAFSQEVLGQQKDFLDFTVEDTMELSNWLANRPSSVTKLLSRMFLGNTVSRLADDAVIVRSLDHKSYRRLIKRTTQRVITEMTGGRNANRKLTVKASAAFHAFVEPYVINAPMGARAPVKKVTELVSQLVMFGEKSTVRGDDSLNRPRDVEIDVDPKTKKVVLRVTPKHVSRASGQLVADKSFTVPVDFEPSSRMFLVPKQLSDTAPARARSRTTQAKKELTQAAIRKVRFPPRKNALKGLAAHLDSRILGQGDITRHMERELGDFLASEVELPASPRVTIMASLPGNGKTEMIDLASRFSGIPKVSINLQGAGSDDPAIAKTFAEHVMKQVNEARGKSPTGKVILVLEELDKIHEKDPTNGALKERPAMAIIKQILDKGVGDHGLDLSNVYTFVTMNFGVDLFNFKPNPMLTGVDDVVKTMQGLQKPMTKKSVLNMLFLPDTVSRLFSERFKVLRPLNAAQYRTLLANQVPTTLSERFPAAKTAGANNKGLVDLELSPQYRSYLFNEAVIPSEGPRGVSKEARSFLMRDLNDALDKFKRSSKDATRPITIRLHYQPGRQKIVASYRLQGAPARTAWTPIYTKEIALRFPTPEARGRMSEKRLLVAAHEFGHAYSRVRLGGRFRDMTVVPQGDGSGGFVRFGGSNGDDDIPTADDMATQVFSAISSRAMERIFLSPDDPRSASAVQRISIGSGTIAIGEGPFAPLPLEKMEGLRAVLKDLEDHMVDDLLAAHPLEFYRDKIEKLARKGVMSEAEFYSLLGYPHPGPNNTPVSAASSLHAIFGRAIKAEPGTVTRARRFRQGVSKTTAGQNREAAVAVLVASIQKHLGGPETSPRPRMSPPMTRPTAPRLPAGTKRPARAKADTRPAGQPRTRGRTASAGGASRRAKAR